MSIKTNIMSFTKSTVSFDKNLKNHIKYDNLMQGDVFERTSKMISKFSEYSKINYNADCQKELTFLSNIYQFSQAKEDDVRLVEKSKSFSKSYEELMLLLCDDENANEDIARNVFCALLENLDNSKNQKASTSLYYYLFDDFLNTFIEANCVKEMANDYINSDILARSLLKKKLKSIYCD